MLFVGTLEPRKNLPALIQAFGQLRKDFPTRLVIAGRNGWLSNDVFETVINRSEAVRAAKAARGNDMTEKERKALSEEEKEYKTKRKQIQEKLIKFAARTLRSRLLMKCAQLVEHRPL